MCGGGENLSPEEQQRRSQEKQKSKQLEQALNTDHAQDTQINKLLLLGAGESGQCRKDRIFLCADHILCI